MCSVGNYVDMTQKQDKPTRRPRSSVEKAAFAAVGAPTAALKALNARVSDLRDTMKTSRKELTGDLAAEIDEWIAEGEKVIERAAERFRNTQWAEEMKESARSTREAARTGVKKARSDLGAMIADEELTVIKGIGPGYADRLQSEGIVGVSRFLDRTATDEDLEGLARSTGIAADTLVSWRRKADLGRITGIGESYQDLLHRAGIWTIDQLATVPASDLMDDINALDPEQAPARDQIARWKSEAARLAE